MPSRRPGASYCITTVCFRERFTQTRTKTAPPLGADQELTLLTAPKFLADTLGLRRIQAGEQGARGLLCAQALGRIRRRGVGRALQ